MTRQLRRLVVGTSLETASDPVVRAALELHRRCQAEVFLVHGFPLPVVYGGGVYGGAAIDSQLDADRRRYEQLLDEQVRRVGAAPQEFAGRRVEMDAGHRLLADVAREVAADLIVVGASEARGPFAPLLGSTADRLLRHTHRPVLVVRGDFAPPKEIVAPVDLSDLSAHAVDVGLSLFDNVIDTDDPLAVQVLFVLSRIDREGSAHFTPEQVDRFATEELEGFIARRERPDGQLRGVLRNGTPRHEILDYLDSHGADLVLLGTHGRSGFERLLLGSVAAEVLRRIDTHALVVPPPPEALQSDDGDAG